MLGISENPKLITRNIYTSSYRCFRSKFYTIFHVNWSASKVNSFLKDSGQYKGSLIKYVRKIFRKTNVSNPLMRTRTCVMVNISIYGKMHFCSYPLNSSAVREKGESQNEYCKKTKACQILWKTNISYPLIRTDACAYQGVRNTFFFGKLGVLCFLVTPALIVALLPYYRQIINSSDKKCDQLVD